MFLLLASGYARAWEPVLYSDPNGPPKLLAVNKDVQQLLLFSNNSPLQKTATMPCSTGQVRGSKLREGDLKTPEGIYFIENFLDQGLDFERYGNLAYTLNFPNPMDRLAGKTGHGIWIHGRGHRIASFETKGCIALNLEDIREVGDEVRLGRTPVVIGRDIQWESSPSEDRSKISARLIRRTREWAEAWAAKKSVFFDMYSAEDFSSSQGRDFAAFRNRKEALFRQYSWIDVWLHEPRVIRGPGYWVSYFGQVFNAPGFYSAGIKRLYWKEDDQGRFRIAGSEWRGLERQKLKDLYLAKRNEELTAFIRKWKEAWEEADLESYRRFYLRDVVQDGRNGLEAVSRHKSELWESGREPEEIQMTELKLSMCPDGFCASFIQDYRDKEGYADKGIKTLVIVPGSSGWRIAREEWRGMN